MDKRIPTLIFDFDGTIADTHQYVVKLYNRIAHELQLHPILEEELNDLKGKTALEIITYLKIPLLKVPSIVSRGKRDFNKEIASLKPFLGLKDVLLELKRTGVRLGILSSNASDNVTHFLDIHQLNIFDFIHTTTMVWSKNLSLKKMIDDHHLDPQDLIYIGDEIRDILMARKLKISVAAVSWGYNSRKVLQQYRPDFLLSEPQELFSIVN